MLGLIVCVLPLFNAHLLLSNALVLVKLANKIKSKYFLILRDPTPVPMHIIKSNLFNFLLLIIFKSFFL